MTGPMNGRLPREQFELLKCHCGSEVFDKIPCAMFERDRLDRKALTMRPTVRFRCAKCTKPIDAQFGSSEEVAHS